VSTACVPPVGACTAMTPGRAAGVLEASPRQHLKPHQKPCTRLCSGHSGEPQQCERIMRWPTILAPTVIGLPTLPRPGY
jgi:hypothetical protein